MNQERKIKVLVAKPGLDGHDKGALVLCSRLRDAGMEVVYTGLRRTVDQIVNAAIQEDVDVLGLSVLSGAHLFLAEKLMKKMKEEGISDKVVLVGGVIPDDDIPKLKNLGVKEVFTQSSTFPQIVEFVKNTVK
jgi:methylmalonyl-CoA mutase C-terminal domain/subunit